MKRFLYLDILRIMAIIAVVMLHVSAQRFYVSFLDPQKNISLAKLYSRNILRIFVAFIIWSVVYELYVFKEWAYASKYL